VIAASDAPVTSAPISASKGGLLPLAVRLNLLRFAIVQFHKFVPSVAMDAQKLIELGLDCLRVPVLRPGDERVIVQVASVATACQSNVSRSKTTHRPAYTSTIANAAGWAVSTPKRVSCRLI
jgi:hypothetical protein